MSRPGAVSHAHFHHFLFSPRHLQWDWEIQDNADTQFRLFFDSSSQPEVNSTFHFESRPTLGQRRNLSAVALFRSLAAGAAGRRSGASGSERRWRKADGGARHGSQRLLDWKPIWVGRRLTPSLGEEKQFVRAKVSRARGLNLVRSRVDRSCVSTTPRIAPNLNVAMKTGDGWAEEETEYFLTSY